VRDLGARGVAGVAIERPDRLVVTFRYARDKKLRDARVGDRCKVTFGPA
jgi:hypothetical protein